MPLTHEATSLQPPALRQLSGPTFAALVDSRSPPTAVSLGSQKRSRNRWVRIQNAPSCRELGLGYTHQRLNLECASYIAELTGRILVAPPLIEAAKHTRCPGDGLANWSTIVDVTGKPVWLGEPPVAYLDEFVRLPLDVSSRGLHSIRSAKQEMVELTLGPMADYCNFYQACGALPRELGSPPALPPSESVYRAASEIVAPLGGFFAYDAVHVRQTDKVTEPNIDLRVPRLNSRSLAQRLMVLLPPFQGYAPGGVDPTNDAGGQGVEPDEAQAFGGGAEPGMSRRRIYVATDAPELVEAYACASSCYQVRSWSTALDELRRWAPQPGLISGGGKCMPYWVTAVERLILERGRAMVYSDNSNFGRAVAVLRRHTIGPEPLRFLMSLAVMPPLPANVSVAHLEMVSLLWTGNSHKGLKQGMLKLPDSIDPRLAGWVNHTAHPAVELAMRRLTLRNDPARSPSCSVPVWTWKLGGLHSLGFTKLRRATCDEV